MKYAKYGTTLGAIIALLILVGYRYISTIDDAIIMPYVFLSLLLYFYLIGFHVCNKTCSFREGLKAGFITGIISMVIVAVTFFLVHNIFFYHETIGDPEKLEGFNASGLLSIQRYLVYSDIRLGILAILAGSLFAAFCSGAGSFTAKKLHH